MPVVRSSLLPAAFAALVNATVWGLAWIPLKWLEAHGVGTLWTTLFIFTACTLAVLVVRPGSVLVAMDPLYEGGLDDVAPGSSCIANAYTSNHELIASGKLGTLQSLALHGVDAVGVVHAVLLRIQTVMLPIRQLVLNH